MNIKENASDKVYNFILSKIKDKEWEINSKIMSENELSKELGVSRVAVRPAIEKLVTLGLLRKKQGIGTYVTSIDASSYMISLMPVILLQEHDMLAMLEYRVYFEYSNVRLFIKNHTNKDLEMLEASFEEMKKNVNDEEAFCLADHNFHKIIAIGTKNPIIIKINEVLTEILKKQQLLLNQSIGSDIGIEYHENLIKYIKDKDLEIASLIMKNHIEDTIKAYKNKITLN